MERDNSSDSRVTFALDFDNTYTRTPQLWDIFISEARKSGNRVFIVTYRDEELDRDYRLDALERNQLVPVFYTGGVAKKFFMQRAGFNIDVWIDDKPETLFENSPMTPDKLAEWRKMNGEKAA